VWIRLVVSTSLTERWCSDAPQVTLPSVATLLRVATAASSHATQSQAGRSWSTSPAQHSRFDLRTTGPGTVAPTSNPGHTSVRVAVPTRDGHCLIHSSRFLMHLTNSRGSQIAQRSRRGKICRSSYRLQWQSGTSSDWHRSACPLDHSSVFIHAHTVPFPQHSFFSRPTPICICPVIE
jgi:hypothetical protein